MNASEQSLRWRIANLLEGDGTSASRWLRGFLIALILINVGAVIFGSMDSFALRFADLFKLFEICSIVIFSLEYLLRLWAVGEPGKRLSFACTPLMLIDLIVLVPFFLGPVAPFDFRMLRLFQLLKLSRHFSSLHILGKVLKAEAQPMAGALAVMMVMILVAASLMHFAEGKIQPDEFGDIPSSMWWAAVTLTTVGYGDVAPVTPVGQLIAGFVMVVGVGMVALPAGMLASRFSQELHGFRSSVSLNTGEKVICPHCHSKIGSLEFNMNRQSVENAHAGEPHD